MAVETFDVVLESVTKRYGRETAVDRISVEIPKGEYLCMLGPSGCGKTTTLRMIAGFIKPDEGDIYLVGQRVNDLPPNSRCTAMVFQSFALFPHLSVYGNVEFGLRMKGLSASERRRRTEAMLGQMDILAMAEKRPEELSMGERQRVALAKSLVIEPQVLLLDEPLSSVDVTLKRKLLMDFREIHDRLGLTFIHVTHDPEEAMANADRILLMSRGTIEQFDTPMNIFNYPKNRFVAEFFQNSNILDGRVEGREEKMITVVSDFGRFRVLAGESIPGINDQVHLVIRHDKVRVAGDKQTENNLEGMVVGESIVGATITYNVRINGDTIFKFQTHMSLDTPRLEPNERVVLAWNPEDARLLS
jgi:ABC-type Fe3+/spermidine/putrescine transport system ATPase subunit